MKRIELSAIVVLAALALAAAACGQPPTTAEQTQTAQAMGSPVPTTNPTPSTIPTVEMEALWATWQGTSLSEMLKTYPVVFVGHVDSVAQRSEPALPGNPDLSAAPAVEGKPRVSGPGPREPYSDYSMTVITPIRGDLSAGQTVTLTMWGGDVELPDGRLQRWVFEGDRLLEVGQTYLLFTLRRDNVLLSVPWGKFTANGDRIEPLSDAWARLGVVQELSGKLAPEAIQQIASPSGD